MTSTINNSPQLDTQGKANQSPRSNPVCLEVNVTLRSLPTEAGVLAQPIREELKTVIVFDNGAVLRSTNNLPAGLSLILSNSNARDVVCRVASGRSMPAVKGYVEVEFMEPVKDFWGIHQDTTPAPAPIPPASPSAPRQTMAPPPPPQTVPPRLTPPVQPPIKSATPATAESPSFDEFPAPWTAPSSMKPDTKPEPAISASRANGKAPSEYNLSEVARPTSVANWTPSAPEPPAEKFAFPVAKDVPTEPSSAPAPTRDFMGKGLMAYDQPAASSGVPVGRTPLILGAAAVVLAAVGGVVFFMHRGSAPTVSVAQSSGSSQPNIAQAAPASTASAPAGAARDELVPPATHKEAERQAQPVASQPIEPATAVGPIPAAVANTSSTDADVRSARQQGKAATEAKQTDAPAAKRPTISSLKISAPIAPKKSASNLGEGAAPVTEIASAEIPAGAAPVALLTSPGRTSAPPAPPSSAAAIAAPASAPKNVTDPKLISSARPAYPSAARQANIEGSVTVVAYIDQSGKVFSARALSGPIMLRAAAEQSVKEWKYSPALEDGKPAQSHTVVKVDFKLN